MPYKDIAVRNAKARQRYAANRELYLARNKQWRTDNAEKYAASKKAADTKATSSGKKAQQNRVWRLRNAAALKEKKKAYAQLNKEAVNARNRDYKRRNPAVAQAMRTRAFDKRKQRMQEDPNYREQQLAKIRPLRRKYYARDKHVPHHNARRRLQNRINKAVLTQGTRKSARTMELVGCTPAELAAHLESKFLPGMTWDNRGEWHIDHKKPCASFDLTDPAQQRECFHFTNLQPLWGVDNLRKGARIQ